MSIDRSKKAGLGEIFAAMAGITEAGITAILKGESVKDHPLAVLANEASSLNWKMKTALIAEPDHTTGDYVAHECVTFLRKAEKTLRAHADTRLTMAYGKELGGTVSDVCEHIQDICMREENSSLRTLTLIKGVGNGTPFKVMSMPYIATPAPQQGNSKETSFTTAAPRRRGRPPKAKAPERQLDFV